MSDNAAEAIRRARSAATALERLNEALAEPGDTVTLSFPLPRDAAGKLADVLDGLSEGRRVNVVTHDPVLGVAAAAHFLGVSIEYVHRLLSDGALPSQGAPQMMLLSDLLAYQRADDRHRRAALDEMTRFDQETGLYHEVTGEGEQP